MISLKTIFDKRSLLIGGCFSAIAFVYLSKRFYFDGGRCKSKARLNGKTVIITGANTGIGKETALDLAKRGARVILACRDSDKAYSAAEDIRKKSRNLNVFVEIVDLSSFKSIREFCQRINSNYEKIHILINNAAMFCCPKWKTQDGFEMQFGVNHLGHFMLTNLLLDKIKQSAPSRIINVSALAYEYGIKSGIFDLDDLNSEKSYDPWTAYQKSKICNILFTLSLAKRLSDTGVTVNALHPGIIRTEITRHYAEAYKWTNLVYKILNLIILPFQLWFLKSVPQGAQTSIYCAVAEELNVVTGKYFSDCKEKKLLKQVLDENLTEKLWRLSEIYCCNI